MLIDCSVSPQRLITLIRRDKDLSFVTLNSYDLFLLTHSSMRYRSNLTNESALCDLGYKARDNQCYCEGLIESVYS